MARDRQIVKHVRAVRNIRTVTNAMQTVAAARFKMVHDRMTEFQPFASHLVGMVSDLVERSDAKTIRHELLDAPEDLQHDVMLVISSNRGLCGSYNQQVLRLAMERLRQVRQGGYDVELHVVGARGVRYLEFRGLEIDRRYSDFGDVPDYDQIAGLARRMMDRFRDREISGLEVVYTQYVSSGQQKPAIAQLLPISDLPAPDGEAREDADFDLRPPYDFWPSAPEILTRLLPATVRIKLYQCFLDAAAAEQFMRRTAMQSATDNADDMLRGLRILANRQRQQQITTELSEIMGGRVGLEK